MGVLDGSDAGLASPNMASLTLSLTPSRPVLQSRLALLARLPLTKRAKRHAVVEIGRADSWHATPKLPLTPSAQENMLRDMP